MIMETAGVAAALATFASVWFGHVAVRWLEFHVARLWVPRAAFLTLGFGLAILSLTLAMTSAAIVAGIVSIVLIYDAFELSRQWKRVREGRAMANRTNAR